MPEYPPKPYFIRAIYECARTAANALSQLKVDERTRVRSST